MNTSRFLPMALTASALLGVLHQTLLAPIWFYIATYDPVVDWIFGTLKSSSTPGRWYALLHIHDVFLNIVLALPLAVLVTSAYPPRRWLLAGVAVVAGFVFTYRGVLFDQDTLQFFIRSYTALLGLAINLLSLPIAMLLVSSTKESRRGV